MKLLIARIEWMSRYAGIEILKKPIGTWAQRGEVPGEAYNFLCAKDGNYYGYWRVGEKWNKDEPAAMRFPDWEDANKPSASNVTVVFVAKSPATGKAVVVGVYNDSVILADGGNRPDRLGRYRARASASDVFLIPEEDRTYYYNYRSRSGWFTYGKPDLADDVNLLRFATGLIAESKPVLVSDGCEGRRVRWARRVERFQSPWLRSLAIKSDEDLVCAACGLQHQKTDHEALKRRFEVHHLELFTRLRPGEKRIVTAEDLVVLCACCHRAIHADSGEECVSDIGLFRRKVLKLK